MSGFDATWYEERRIHLLGYVAELEAKPEFAIINSINTTSTPEEAVQVLLTHMDTFVATSDLGNKVWDVACIVLELVERTPVDAQAPLLAFIQELQRQIVTDRETGNVVDIDGSLLWTDLPTFGYAFGDQLASMSTYNVKAPLHNCI